MGPLLSPCKGEIRKMVPSGWFGRSHFDMVAMVLTVSLLLLGGHSELVGTVVPALVRALGLLVPLDLPPPHLLVALRRFQKSLPQIPVRYRFFAVVEPSVLPPLLVPAPPHAVDEVGGVGVDGHCMPLVYGLQGDTSSCYLHPQVGGILLAAADLFGLPLPIDYGTV